MDSHIINLLKTNNRVIIPEFGAFIVKSGSPRTIVFNEFLKYNDEVLLKEICRAENISEDDATNKLNEFTRELNSQLDLGQHHKMGSLGMLSKDNNGRIHFQMFGGADALESSEDSESVELNEPVQLKKETTEIKSLEEPFEISKETKVQEEPVATNKESKEGKPLEDDLIKKVEAKKEAIQNSEVKKEEPPKENIKKENVPQEKISASTTNVEEKNKQPLTLNEKLQAKSKRPEKPVVTPIKEAKKEEKAPITAYLSNNKNIVWYSLVAVVLVAIIWWFLAANKEYLFDSSDSKKTAKTDEVVIQPQEKENLTDENVESNVSDAAEEERNEPAELPKEEVKEPIKTQPIVNNKSGVKRYYIVAGCFQQESNADNYVSYLNGQGYNSKKFGKYGGLFAVSFDSYDSFSDAQKELNKIKKSTEPEAWILYY